jgi:hypothetical protein
MNLTAGSLARCVPKDRTSTAAALTGQVVIGVILSHRRRCSPAAMQPVGQAGSMSLPQ